MILPIGTFSLDPSASLSPPLAAPADQEELVQSFLADDRFLIVSPNAYNGLGVGTTQLYNKPVVYNRKRHGDFELNGRPFEFRRRRPFPRRLAKSSCS